MGSHSLEVMSSDALQQVDRVLDGSTLRGSETLRKLLRYLVSQRFERPNHPVKEAQIAHELLSKGDDFDARLDPTVRVQVGRLRSKLVEYYATEGAEDDLLIEIPKGSYDVVFRTRTPLENEEPLPITRETIPETGPQASVNPWWSHRYALAGIFLMVGVGLGSFILTWLTHDTAPIPGRSLQTFWRGFVDSPNPPLVVFSNGAFVGNPVTGLRYYNPIIDSDRNVLDHYTGVGEVLAIHELDTIFFGMKRTILVKRGRLLSWDDTRNRGVVFIGSPSENLAVKEISYEPDFTFRRMTPDSPVLALVNLRPRDGESPAYAAAGDPLTDDYALISLIPDVGDSHPQLLLAGTTTLGTQAAVEFVCHESTVSQILDRMRDRKIVPFAAVIHTKITGGVPVSSEIVTLHHLKGRNL